MANSIYDVHIAALQVIENELQRLHHDLRVSAGDDDVTQEQITELHNELARLSESLGDAEIENENG